MVLAIVIYAVLCSYITIFYMAKSLPDMAFSWVKTTAATIPLKVFLSFSKVKKSSFLKYI